MFSLKSKMLTISTTSPSRKHSDISLALFCSSSPSHPSRVHPSLLPSVQDHFHCLLWKASPAKCCWQLCVYVMNRDRAVDCHEEAGPCWMFTSAPDWVECAQGGF